MEESWPCVSKDRHRLAAMFKAADKHLYIHIPYCAQKCPYCDFNSIAGRDEEQDDYVDALLKELQRYQGRSYKTIFIGGGTPTHLAPKVLERFLVGLRSIIKLDNDYEWTSEANPGSTDAAQLSILKEHGVNRISIGVQSTHEKHLAFLGRIHNTDEAKKAIASACEIFQRVSCDLMFGLPQQTVAEIQSDLKLYQEFSLQHASVYHLTIEPGTEFAGLYKRGMYQEISQEDSWQQLQFVRETLAGYGLAPYETSNFAHADQHCLHNMAYWLQRDYDAAGAGAVSTVGGRRITRLKHPKQYIESINKQGHAHWQEEQLSLHDIICETWMLGLRLQQGVAIKRLEQLGDARERWQSLCDRFIEQGLLQIDGEHISLNDQGRPLQDHITATLMPDN